MLANLLESKLETWAKSKRLSGQEIISEQNNTTRKSKGNAKITPSAKKTLDP